MGCTFKDFFSRVGSATKDIVVDIFGSIFGKKSDGDVTINMPDYTKVILIGIGAFVIITMLKKD